MLENKHRLCHCRQWQNGNDFQTAPDPKPA